MLERFREAGLPLRREKCYLGKEEVKWFCMIYNRYGMSSDPKKVAVIRDWPAPRTVRDVKSFLHSAIQRCLHGGRAGRGNELSRADSSS